MNLSLFDNALFVPSTTGRGMVPTDLALQLEPEVNAVIERLQRLVVPRSVFNPKISNRTFVIALSKNPTVMLMPELIPLIRGKAPGVRIASVLPNRERSTTAA